MEAKIMQTIISSQEISTLCKEWQRQGLKIGFVPTMGYFHQGHLSLMDEARKQCDKLVVSLFVNPTQFGPNEDLDNYPRDHERDSRLAQEHGADVLFMPEAASMYAEDHGTWIEVPELARGLCGKSRPIHFRGVCTVVTKLFNLVRPDVAVFGQKDWQQLAIIRRMVRDLNMDVEIIGHPIVREEDGLALSSRNAYLTEQERTCAPAIRQTLLRAGEMAKKGTPAKEIRQWIVDGISAGIPMGRIDYIEIVDPESLIPVNSLENNTLAAVAVFIGKARLIDNFLVEV